MMGWSLHRKTKLLTVSILVLLPGPQHISWPLLCLRTLSRWRQAAANFVLQKRRDILDGVGPGRIPAQQSRRGNPPGLPAGSGSHPAVAEKLEDEQGFPHDITCPRLSLSLRGRWAARYQSNPPPRPPLCCQAPLSLCGDLGRPHRKPDFALNWSHLHHSSCSTDGALMATSVPIWCPSFRFRAGPVPADTSD